MENEQRRGMDCRNIRDRLNWEAWALLEDLAEPQNVAGDRLSQEVSISIDKVRELVDRHNNIMRLFDTIIVWRVNKLWMCRECGSLAVQDPNNADKQACCHCIYTDSLKSSRFISQSEYKREMEHKYGLLPESL